MDHYRSIQKHMKTTSCKAINPTNKANTLQSSICNLIKIPSSDSAIECVCVCVCISTFSLTASSLFEIWCCFWLIEGVESRSATSCCRHSNWEVIMRIINRNTSRKGLDIITSSSHKILSNNKH